MSLIDKLENLLAFIIDTNSWKYNNFISQLTKKPIKRTCNSDKNGKQIVPLIVCSLIHTIYKPDAIGLENVRGRVIDFVT